jgi:hypothetical protein
MAISFVAAGAVATVVSSNLNIAVPAGFAKNDLLIATVTTGTVAVTTPAGWELLSAYTGGLPYLYVFYKYASVSESTLVVPTTSVVAKGVMLAYRGGSAFQIVPVTATGASSTATPNTITTTYANTYSINFYCTSSASTRTWTPNASTTARVNSSSIITGNGQNGLLVADELRVAIGTGPARAATLSGNIAWSCVTVGLIEDRTLYWVGGNGTWANPSAGTTGANWANSSGGAGGAIVPTQNDAVIVDGNSGSPTITLSGLSSCASLTTTGATCALTGVQLVLNGSMTLSATTTWSSVSEISCIGTGTLTTNGVTLNAAVLSFNGASQTFTLGGATTTSTSIVLTRGTLALNGFDLTANIGTFDSNNTNTRSINFGSNYINLARTSAATVINATTLTGFTFTGAGGFRLTGAAASGVTRTVVIGTTGGTVANAPNVLVTAGAAGSIVTMTSNSWVRSLDTTGFSGTFTPNSLSLAGSLTYGSGTTVGSGTITFASTTTGNTITTNGRTVGSFTFNGVGGAWTLQDNVTSSGAFTLTAGSLTTNNNTINATTFSSSGTNARTLNLGASTINLSNTSTAWNFATTTNLTFNSGTSQINVAAGGSPTFEGGGLTYYNVNFDAPTLSFSIFGNNTFNTLSSPAADYTLTLTGTTQTVTNFNIDGLSYSDPVTLNGGTLSKSSGTVSLSYARISTAATGGATWNAFGCQQISTAATGWNFGVQTRYLIGAGAVSGYDAPGRWSTTSGGASNAMAPFQFDDVIFDANSGSVTFSTDLTASIIKSLNASTFTGVYDPGIGSDLDVYGSFILGSSMTLAGGHSGVSLFGTASGNLLTIGTSNKFIASTLTLNCSSGDYTLTTNCSVRDFDALSGTFNFGSNTFTANTISDSGSTGNVTLNFSSSTINLSGTLTPFQYVRLTDVDTTVNAGTSTINLTDFSTSANGHNFTSNKTFNIVNLDGIVAGEAVEFTNGPTISRLTTNNTVGGYNLFFADGTTTTIGTFDIRGTAGNLVTVNSTSTSVNATLASLGSAVQSNIDYLSFIDITASPAPTATGTAPYYWYVGANSIQDTATTGLVFSSDTSYTYYNLTSGTSWSVPANWNNSVNNVYLIGGGGGGSGSVVASSTGSHNSGSGGGGGGFTALTNTTLTPGGTVSYAIGAAGAAGTGSTSSSTAGGGGTTTFNISNTAGGGGGAATGLGTATVGTAGTGSTFNGGAGGSGTAPNSNTTNAGGGGAGSGGLNGAGVSGGANSGATIGAGGAGNNNLGDYLFVSGAPYGDGGNGGATAAVGVAAAGRGGGGGGGGTTAGSSTVRAGGLGTQGVIVLRYQVPAPPSSGNFLTFFYQ